MSSIPQWVQRPGRKAGTQEWLLECQDLGEFLNAFNAPSKSTETGLRHHSDPRSRFACVDAAFCGVPSFDAGMAMMLGGWPEGARKAKELSDAVTRKVASITAGLSMERPAPVHDVAGDDCDVDRYLSGVPENMISWETETIRGFGKVATLIVDSSVSGCVSPESLMKIAVGVGAVVDALEENGVRVEVVVGYCSQHHGTVGLASIRHWIKKASEPLDLGRLTASMHPFAYRCVGFRWWDALPHNYSGYGMPNASLPTEGKPTILNCHILCSKEPANWASDLITALLAPEKEVVA